ncbi:MAG: hypothetical protein ACFWT7_00310 [Succiniclasticum sp.]
MKTVVACAYSKMHVNFYLRMRKAFLKEGYSLLILASQYSSYRYALNHGCPAKLSHVNGTVAMREAYHGLANRLQNSMDIKLGLLSLSKAVKYYKSVYELLEQINEERKISLVVAFQNARTEEIAFHDFAANHNIMKLFFEFSNMPGKIFCDREGSNKKSELYLSKNKILDQFDCPTDAEYESWKKDYLKIKFQQISIPQAKITFPRSFLEKLEDMAASLFITHIPATNINLKRAISVNLNKLHKNQDVLKWAVQIDTHEMKGQYIFFPLQVSSDTQIIVNSDIGLIEALKRAVKLAARENKKLVIKPHPAEFDKSAQETILRLARENGCIISVNNTFHLIEDAYKVITINSTVGLESMILGTPVIVLADPFYKNFTFEQLKKYLLRYLVNIELFSVEEIPDVTELLKRASV